MDKTKIEQFNIDAAEQRRKRDADYIEFEKLGKVSGKVPRERITKLSFPRVPKEIIDGYLSIPDMSSTVSDVLDKYGIDGAIPSTIMKPLIPGTKICGTAVTIRNIPVRKTVTKGYEDKDDNISAKEHKLGEEGDVCVFDSCGFTDVSSIGGNGALQCRDNGYAGLIIHGACRDVNIIRDAGYPVFCCGTTPISNKNRMECIEINGPVVICGKRLDAGDLIMADDSGVCIVPYGLAEEVLKKCL